MSYATIPRPGTVGDDVKTNLLLSLLQGPENNLNMMREDRMRGDPMSPDWSQGPPQAGPQDIDQGPLLDQLVARSVTAAPAGKYAVENFMTGGVDGPVAGDSQVPLDMGEILPDLAAKPVFKASGPGVPVAPPTKAAAELAAMTKGAPASAAGVAAGGAPKSGKGGVKPSVLPASPAQPAASEAPAASTPVDAIAEMLAAKQKTAEGDRDNAKSKALLSKDMSDGEKLFTALMAAVPGLAGLFGGLAISGGAGGMAGLAGGLNGGAGAIGTMIGEKEQLRQEALGDADKAQGRIDQAGNQLLGHQEKLGDRAYQTSERKDGQQFSAQRDDKHMALQASEGAANRNMQLRTTMIHEKGAYDRAAMDAENALQKAMMSAKAAGGDMKDYQGKAASFATTMLLSKDVLDDMKDPGVWNTMATWGGLRSAMADPTRQKYARAMFNFLDAVTRDVSGAAITPEDWDVKFKQYMGNMGSSPEDLQYAKQFRDSQTKMMLRKAGPGGQMAMDSYQEALEGAQPRPAAHALDANAIAWARANPKDPAAADILRLNGIQ